MSTKILLCGGFFKQSVSNFTVDGKEYDTDKLSDEARNQLISIQYVGRKIQELNLEQAAYQTARNAYARALTDMLNTEGAQNEEASHVLDIRITWPISDTPSGVTCRVSAVKTWMNTALKCHVFIPGFF
jgi:hypothetical protein